LNPRRTRFRFPAEPEPALDFVSQHFKLSDIFRRAGYVNVNHAVSPRCFAVPDQLTFGVGDLVQSSHKKNKKKEEAPNTQKQIREPLSKFSRPVRPLPPA
jgi:hypothetical protein